MSGSVLPKIWFITGASSGLGLQIALSALRAGHRVIGTSRNIQNADMHNPEFKRLGGQWLELDVSQPEAQDIVTQLADTEHERLHWVVVNNAGHTPSWSSQRHERGPDLPISVDTISSIWGFVSKAEHMMYSAAKAATESLTESYATLLSPFGIKTLIVEPGGFRTRFPAKNIKADGGVTEDYKEKITEWMNIVDAAGRDPTMVQGDPKRLGNRVLDAVEGRGLFQNLWAGHEKDQVLRIQLGSDCYAIFGKKLKRLGRDYAEMETVAKSTDFGA